MFTPESPPEWSTTRWLNTKEPLTLEALKGKVVVLYCFQMLCPGCVTQGWPLVQRLAANFNPQEVAFVALHTVFEHQDVMTEKALEAFVHEYRIRMPVGIDEPNLAGPPRTMTSYELRGTPSWLVFDRKGRLRRHYFGQPGEIMLAAELMALAIEDKDAERGVALKIEQALAQTLRAPEDHGHDHGHDHDHHHHHHDGACCGHDHGHAHGHGHAHDHDHAHGASDRKRE